MEWISDVSVGDWLRDRLSTYMGADSTMHSVVPYGFEAYARIFHPVPIRSLPDRAVPDLDEWERMPEAEQNRLMGLFTDEEITWAATAEAFGTSMHPLAQWERIVQVERDVTTRIAPDGREFNAPEIGSLTPTQLTRLATLLSAHTATAGDATVGVWPGRAGVVGHMGHASSHAFSQFGYPDSPELAHHNQMLGQSFKDRFNDVFRRKTWQEGILSREISEGPQLKLPGREYVLFHSSIRAFEEPEWILDAPWRDRPAEGYGFERSPQAPNLIWPADHAWLMVSEIDYDSTIVAGSSELIQAICSDGELEALPIPEGAELHWEADKINR